MVYFVRHMSSGLIKIGHSDNVTSRMRCLLAEHGPLDLLAVTHGSRDAEGELHLRFAAHNAAGEWFRPAPDLTDHIAGLVSLEPVGPVLGPPRQEGPPRARSVYVVPPVDPLAPYSPTGRLTLTPVSLEPRWPRVYR